MANKKYLDEVGLAYILGKLEDYPDNEILATLIDAIQDALDEKVDINNSFDLSDRLAKGIDSQENEIVGAVIEGSIEDCERTIPGTPTPIAFKTNVASGEYSHAEGLETTASGYCSHSENHGTIASNNYSHAEGYGTIATGASSHAEGGSSSYSFQIFFTGDKGTTTYTSNNLQSRRKELAPGRFIDYNGDLYKVIEFVMSGQTIQGIKFDKTLNPDNSWSNQRIYITALSQATGDRSHVEGESCAATGSDSHAEGFLTLASGPNSHAEGSETIASNAMSHAEGYNTTASGAYSHVEGYNTIASSAYSHAEGYNTTTSGSYSHAEGQGTMAAGASSHAEGQGIQINKNVNNTNYTTSGAYGTASHTEGYGNLSVGNYSHTEGYYNVTVGNSSHAEGNAVSANGNYSHAEGNGTTASGITAHAEGNVTQANGSYSHAEGGGTKANGDYSHAEGGSTTASGSNSHTEGTNTNAQGGAAHAEGVNATATSDGSHAEGGYTVAAQRYAHAEGQGSIAAGENSHASGYYTTASRKSQFVFGEYNNPETGSGTTKGTYIEQVGNGTSNTRSNARTLDWNGNEILAGKLTVGAAPTNNMDVTTKQYVDTALNSKASTDLATQSSPGLMSSMDKIVLDNFNPNISVTLDEMAVQQFEIINAKQENALSLENTIEPQVGAQIRTSNLLDVDTYTQGYYIGSNGALATNANDRVGEFIPVNPGDTIYYTGIIGPTNSSSINRRLHVYNANQTWIRQLNFAGGLKVGDHWSTNGVVPDNGAYIRVSWGVEDTNVMISVGAPTKYEPYYIKPFATLTNTTISISSDNTVENTNNYQINFPAAAGDVYSAKVYPIEGKIYITSGHINSYNGETLTTQWWSDRDIYSEEATPTIGAEVVYALDEEDYIEYNITPITMPLFYLSNSISVGLGVITSFTYYAETFGVKHITISEGMTFGKTHVLEEDIQNWNNTTSLMETKANLDSPAFINAPTSTTPGLSDNSTRIATTAYVQTKMNNLAKNEINNRATQDYTAGDYVCINGTFYKVTANVARNSTLTVGTNIEATTVGDQLKLLMDAVFS